MSELDWEDHQFFVKGGAWLDPWRLGGNAIIDLDRLLLGTFKCDGMQVVTDTLGNLNSWTFSFKAQLVMHPPSVSNAWSVLQDTAQSHLPAALKLAERFPVVSPEHSQHLSQLQPHHQLVSNREGELERIKQISSLFVCLMGSHGNGLQSHHHHDQKACKRAVDGNWQERVTSWRATTMSGRRGVSWEWCPCCHATSSVACATASKFSTAEEMFSVAHALQLQAPQK